ncbi:MAG: succinate dehydrogenase flavoprotein subunit [Candidatus Eisenbacteria bacterium]|uniref:succinate dehydrogenase n=1 Tax=Eiseniibacteriota bacterium TaxID=2212470 RepID=A0A849SPC3_UNCEI|nr:succinate dehydrogenase flavoprotein subunit [Candidatus Eisenbacteria bacterium]
MAETRIAVVGGGLAGLMAAIRIAEAGVAVDLFSVVPVKRSHSVCAQGGINGAVNVKGENDSPEIHFFDSVKGGDFLAHQPPVKAMCYAAPGIIYLLDRMGVTFNRTPEGFLDFRRFGGTLHHRTAFAGATTGQQMLYALDEQVRRYEVAGLVTKYESWEFLGLVKDDGGRCVGTVALDLRSMKPRAFRADAVILATGGPGLLFGRSTNSIINSGSAAAAAYREGAWYANGEFIQVHPTAIPGEDKLRLMSESARGEGGRVWVPKQAGDPRGPREIPESERWYFLEEKYPRFKNLVPRDVASREIHHVCVDRRLGVGGRNEVYLDLTHLSAEELDRKLGGIIEIYEKFTGDDPRKIAMRISPAVHYSMGGLWVDYERTADGFLDHGSTRNQMTNVPGLYAIGECEYQYHGANRLGANSLLSCVYGGQIGGPAAVAWTRAQAGSVGELPSAPFEAAERHWTRHFEALAKRDGPENPYVLWDEMGELMLENVTIVRENAKLKATDDKLRELRERWDRTTVLDHGSWANGPLSFLNQLENMLELARVVTIGALQRDESRGAHFKPDFPKRDDVNWLKTTVAIASPDGPRFRYDPVDTSLAAPVERKYD